MWKALFIVWVLIAANAFAAEKDMENGKAALIKYLYVQKLPKYVAPLSHADQAVTICFFKGDPLEEFIAEVETDGINVVFIEKNRPLKDFTRCGVLYLSEAIDYEIEKLVDFCQNHSILFVSDIPGFIKDGGMIGLVEKYGSIKLELNIHRMVKTGFSVNPKLIEIATKIIR